MKRIYIVIISILCILLVTSVFCLPRDYHQLQMYNEIEMVYSYYQFDSLCKVDRISNDLKEWDSVYFLEEETGQPICEYLYFNHHNDTTFVYTISDLTDSTLFINKRIEIR